MTQHACRVLWCLADMQNQACSTGVWLACRTMCTPDCRLASMQNHGGRLLHPPTLHMNSGVGCHRQVQHSSTAMMRCRVKFLRARNGVSTPRPLSTHPTSPADAISQAADKDGDAEKEITCQVVGKKTRRRGIQKRNRFPPRLPMVFGNCEICASAF